MLINPVIQHVVTEEKYGFIELPQYKFKLNHIDLLQAGKEQLTALKHSFNFNDDIISSDTNFLSSLHYFTGDG